jgi:hypothetical protein
MIWQRHKPQPHVVLLRKIVNVDAGRESNRKASLAKSMLPKGMQPDQIAWAMRHRTDPEAETILGFAAEGPIVLKW